MNELVTRLSPGGSVQFSHLSNAELLARTQQLVGKSNQVLAALLAHLAEVEARGLYRQCACSTLHAYCIYELRFSEDAASRRSAAAKLVRRFPALLDAIAAGELHLTGLLQLSPVLTEENQADVVARAKFRTKKEIGKLVRQLAPLPAVPDCIEPLGPELPRALRNPTWQEFVESLCPPVRQLPPGKRPADWARDALDAEQEARDATDAELQSATAEASANAAAVNAEATAAGSQSSQVTATALARKTLPPLDEPQLYQLQFTSTEEHTQLIERAKALLAEKGVSLGELHLQAMRLLVERLETKKYGASSQRKITQSGDEQDGDAARHDGTSKRSRYIPAWLRRAVFERDNAQCTFVDARGQRCRETHFLEIHHLHPFALRGPHALANLTLRCQSHNALAAEQDFGPEYAERKRQGRLRRTKSM